MDRETQGKRLGINVNSHEAILHREQRYRRLEDRQTKRLEARG